MGCEIGNVAVVVPDALLSVSDTSVVAVSLLSLSLSSSSGSAGLQHVSNLGLFGMYLFIKLIIKPAVIRTNNSVICGGKVIIKWITRTLL